MATASKSPWPACRVPDEFLHLPSWYRDGWKDRFESKHVRDPRHLAWYDPSYAYLRAQAQAYDAGYAAAEAYIEEHPDGHVA